MVKKAKKNIKIDKYFIGVLLAYAYVFVSYIAHDFFVSSALIPLFLYAFLLSSVYILITEMKLHKNILGFVAWYGLLMLFSVILMMRMPNISEVFNDFYAMIVAFLLAVSLQIHVKTEEKFRAMCRCYAISSFVLVVLLFFTGNLKGAAGDRLGQEFFDNANSFAWMMMIGAMYTIWLLIYDAKKPLCKLMWCFILVADMYAMMLSAGRKFLIITLVFLYILLWFKKDKKGRKHILLYTVIFILLVLTLWIAIMNIPILYNAIGIRMDGFIDSMSGSGGDASSVVREQMRELAVQKWLDKPFFGYGFDSFKYLAQNEVNHFFYSHCNYTELLYCGGIFYFVLYYWFSFRLLQKSLLRKDIPIPYKAFTVGVALCLTIFDYGAVSYNVAIHICMLMMANCATFFTNKTSEGEL